MSSTVKPSRSEDEYFAKQDIEKKKRLALQVKEKYLDQEREKLKQIHWMHCSKCGMDLQQINYQGFMIEKCFNCGAVVLDGEEFEKLAGKEEGFLSEVVRLFR